MNIYRIIYLGLLLCTLIVYLTGPDRKQTYSKIIAGLMLVWLLTASTAIILIRLFHLKTNLIVFHISTPAEYILLGWFYYLIITNPMIKKIIRFSLFIFPFLCIIFLLYVQGVGHNNSYMIITESLILIFLSLFYLREVLLFQPVASIQRLPAFWICVGVLIYYVGNLLIEGLLNYMVSHSMSIAGQMYLIGYIFKCLLFICFIAGRILQYRPRKIHDPQ